MKLTGLTTFKMSSYMKLELYFTNIRVLNLVTNRAELVIVWKTAGGVSGLY